MLICLCQDLALQLKSLKDDAKETSSDKLHKANVTQGRDKYKTLKQIRQGNTKQRVEEFESM